MIEKLKESEDRRMRLLNILYDVLNKFADEEGELENREVFSVLHTMVIDVFRHQFPLEERKEKFIKICDEIIKPGSPLYQDAIE